MTWESARKKEQETAEHGLRAVHKQLLDLTSTVARIGTASAMSGKEIIRSAEHDRIFDMDPDEPFNMEILMQFVHPDDRAYFENAIKESERGGEHSLYNIKVRIIRRDGAVRWVHAWGKSHWDPELKVPRYIGATRDITDEKKIQEDREMMIAMLSHDMRNPLTVAHSHAQLLLRNLDNIEDKRAIIQQIISSIEQVNGMIGDILDLSRVRAGYKQSLRRKQCDLKAVLEDALKELRVVYGDRFVFNAEDGFQGLWASSEIKRLFENLAHNAVKHGDPVAPVTVTLSRSPDHNTVFLAVKNEGNPISPEEQKQIFEPFHKTKNSESRRTVGWGLGLAIAQTIAEALGTTLHLQSGSLTGTVFSIAIPV